jgi:hypothetical protein
MNLADLIPGLMPTLRSLTQSAPAMAIKDSTWLFALFQNIHLLALFTLGGCVILTNLRLMGAGLTTSAPSSLTKSLTPLLWAALIITILTGMAMGFVLAPRLYARAAFLVKLISLASALVLTLGAAIPVMKREGQVTKRQVYFAIGGLVLWLLAVLNFGFSDGPAAGTFHVIAAGWLIAMAFGSKQTRLALGAVTAVIVIGVGIFTYGLHNPLDDYELVMETNRWTLRLAAILVAGALIWEFARRPAADMQPPARLIGLITLLAWVTVAIAGRWIGLGGGGS